MLFRSLVLLLADRGPGHGRTAISEEEHEVVLNAETPVVAKETVAVERVHLDTRTVTNQQTVSAEVREENIEILDDTTTGKGTPRR